MLNTKRKDAQTTWFEYEREGGEEMEEQEHSSNAQDAGKEEWKSRFEQSGTANNKMQVRGGKEEEEKKKEKEEKERKRKGIATDLVLTRLI